MAVLQEMGQGVWQSCRVCGSPAVGCGSPAGGVVVLEEVWQSCRGCGSPAGGVTVLKGAR